MKGLKVGEEIIADETRVKEIIHNCFSSLYYKKKQITLTYYK